MKVMTTKFALAAYILGLLGVVGIAAAADKNDPTGTWKWTSKFGDKEVERTMKLELKDGKLTGTVSGGGKGGGKGGGDSKIEDGKFKDGELSFSVTRERGDMKIVSKYSGKVSDDTIKGTITTDFNGKENKQEFEAKRSKDEKKKD
jgi:hypothetical protein